MSIRAIIQRCGGARRISEESAKGERFVARKTVYSWLLNGIPERHWGLISRLAGVAVEDIHRANRELAATKDLTDAPTLGATGT